MDSTDKRAAEEAARKKSRRVYTTDLINKLINDRNQGYDIDYDPFFNRDVDLRNSGVPFRMTAEEMEEYQKCYDDPEYFIDNYCRFMTDKGLKTVELRDYQKKVIKRVTEEVYDDGLNDIIPRNKNLIWLASRQVGKCLSFNTVCDFTSNKKDITPTKIGDKFWEGKSKTFLQKIIHFLYKVYFKL